MRVPLQVRGPEKTRTRASRTAGPPASGTERRTVQLAVTGVRPWTVLRIWIVIGTLFYVILLAALVIVYTMLSATGALASIERAINSGGIGHHFAFSLAWIMTRAAQIGSAIVVVSAALAACLTAVFNAVAELLGGIELTVSA